MHRVRQTKYLIYQFLSAYIFFFITKDLTTIPPQESPEKFNINKNKKINNKNYTIRLQYLFIFVFSLKLQF